MPSSTCASDGAVKRVTVRSGSVGATGPRRRYSHALHPTDPRPPRIKPVVMVARDGDGRKFQTRQRIQQKLHIAIIQRVADSVVRMGVRMRMCTHENVAI